MRNIKLGIHYMGISFIVIQFEQLKHLNTSWLSLNSWFNSKRAFLSLAIHICCMSVCPEWSIACGYYERRLQSPEKALL